MRYSENIKPISYLKANAADVLKNLRASGMPMVITQNGEATAVLQDVQSYEKAQEQLALLKILALGNREVDEGKLTALDDLAARYTDDETVLHG